MGYRTYIGKINKRDYNKIKSLLSVEDVYSYYNKIYDREDYNGDYHCVYDFGTELHGFGKYTNFRPPKGSIKPFFKKKDVQKHWGEEHDFYVASPEFLKYLIDYYTELVRVNYREVLQPFFDDKGNIIHPFLKSGKIEDISETDTKALFGVIDHVRLFACEWGVANLFKDFTPYNIGDGDHVITSWKYEYGIIELVRIYKTFDWKRNVLLYYGY